MGENRGDRFVSFNTFEWESRLNDYGNYNDNGNNHSKITDKHADGDQDI